MTKIRHKTYCHIPGAEGTPGQVVEVSDELANAIVGQGVAELVELDGDSSATSTAGVKRSKPFIDDDQGVPTDPDEVEIEQATGIQGPVPKKKSVRRRKKG